MPVEGLHQFSDLSMFLPTVEWDFGFQIVSAVKELPGKKDK